MENDKSEITLSQTDVAVNRHCLLGECPVWDAKRQVICWIDILKGEIYEYSPGQNTIKTTAAHQMIGSIAICSNGSFLAALKNGFAFVNRQTGEVKMITNPESHLPDNRFNEGKCDPAKRFWAGTISLAEKEPVGSVYVLNGDLSVTKKIAGVTISNGMAWSLDQSKFYYIDTPTFEVSVYDYDKSTGSIKNKKTAIKVPKKDGYPDGMTTDNEGMLWIAHFGGWQVTRWNPQTAEKLFTVKLPVSQVTSCAFGGADFSDLYITTASKELTADELKKEPLAGSLFVLCNSRFTGLPAFEFDV